MEIRKFKESDRSAVIELWETCGLTRAWNNPNKDIDRKVQFQSELYFVGTINLEVIGSAMAGYDGHRGSVFYLAIHPKIQGMGYGQKLMDYIETVLTELGCPKLNIVVRAKNEQVLKFYSNLSYSADGVVNIGKRLIPDA